MSNELAARFAQAETELRRHFVEAAPADRSVGATPSFAQKPGCPSQRGETGHVLIV